MRKNTLTLFFMLIAILCFAQSNTIIFYAKDIKSQFTSKREYPIICTVTRDESVSRARFYDPITQQLLLTMRGTRVFKSRYSSAYMPDSSFAVTINELGKVIFDNATKTTTFFDANSIKTKTYQYLFDKKDTIICQTDFYTNGNKKTETIAVNPSVSMEILSGRHFSIGLISNLATNCYSKLSLTETSYFYNGGTCLQFSVTLFS